MKTIKWLLVLYLLILTSSFAHATILWYGGEDTSFTPIGAFSTIVTCSATVLCRPAFARYALGIQNGATVADPPANRLQTSTFTAGASIWVHGQYSSNISGPTTTLNEQGLIIRSPDGVSRIVVRQTGTNGQVKVTAYNAARTPTDLAVASGTFPVGATTQFDLQVNYTCSGAGAVNMWLAAVQVIAFTGNPCTDAATTLNQVEFASFNNATTACNVSLASSCWSELIIADEDTRSMALVTCGLQAAGPTQQFLPNTLANVNKTTIDDTSFVSTATNNQLSQWTCPTAAPVGIWAVRSVSIEARALHSTTGPQNLDFSTQYNLSPATGSAWGIPEVFNTGANQLSIGVKDLP